MFSRNPPSAKEIAEPITEGIVQSGKQSALLSMIAVGVALISIVITAFFSYHDYKGDEKWQSEQIKSLTNK